MAQCDPKERGKGDILEDMSKDVPKPAEKRESVRGKLEYYQELIHQLEKQKREEELEI